MLTWAILSSYARVYLGVHFISDIVAGLFFGALIGLLVYRIYVFSRTKLLKTPFNYSYKSIYSVNDGNTLGIGIISYITLVLLLGAFLSSIPHTIMFK